MNYLSVFRGFFKKQCINFIHCIFFTQHIMQLCPQKQQFPRQAQQQNNNILSSLTNI